jgi:hypothetical protein
MQMNKIERLNRMRRNILLIVLAGTGIAFGLLISPAFIRSARHQFWVRPYSVFVGPLLIWLLTLSIFSISYVHYKKKLKKDPVLQVAVNDERVRVNWLRAYRFAFIALIVITVFWKCTETILSSAILKYNIFLPDGPWLVLFGGILSVISSFLYYNRGAVDE